MRENRTYSSEGGDGGAVSDPYPGDGRCVLTERAASPAWIPAVAGMTDLLGYRPPCRPRGDGSPV